MADDPPARSHDDAAPPDMSAVTADASATTDDFPRNGHRPLHDVGAGTVIAGRYKLLRQIGQGGFGVVYLADQDRPVRRRVAVKLIKLGMDSEQVLARFDAERQALALLSHPNVAAVYDAGVTDSGRPFFVMEYVPGEPITAFCDRHRYTTRQRLELFVQACEAVQHAHQKAIIHRDLKPSNLLVTLQEGDKPLVKVIDFGVAKATAQRLTEHTLFTEQGQLIGTPEYMSPEQAELNAVDIDTRTDIYSLGVVLYELLAGAVPFDGKTLRNAAFAQIQRIIRDVDPPRMSTRLSSLGDSAIEVAKHRQTGLQALQRELRGELEWIPLKALRKDRAHRYRSATEFADDVRHYLADRPLLAGPESAGYRARKFLSRYKGPVAAAVAVLAVLIAGVAVSTWQATRIAAEQRKTRAEKNESDRLRGVAERSEHAVELELLQNRLITGTSLLQSKEPDQARESFSKALDLSRKLHQTDLGAVVGLLRSYVELPPPIVGVDGRSGGVQGFDNTAAPVLCAAFVPDGRTVISGDASGELRSWDVRLGTARASRAAHTGSILSLSVSLDGRVLATAGDDNLIRLWDPQTLNATGVLEAHQSPVKSLAFSLDGKLLASGDLSGVIRLWATDTWSPRGVLPPHPSTAHGLSFTPDGRRLISVHEDGKAKIWDVDALHELSTLASGRGGALPAVAVTPDGKHAWIGGFGTEVWDLQSQQLLYSRRGHAGMVGSVSLSRNGQLAATAGRDGTARVWDTSTGNQLRLFTGHRGRINVVTLSPDGSLLLTGGDDKTLRLWNLRDGSDCPTWAGHTERICTLTPSADGSVAYTSSFDSTVGVWDVATGKRLRTIPVGVRQVWSVAPIDDGRQLLVGGEGAYLALIDGVTGQVARTFKGHTDVVTCVAVSGDGRFAASSSSDGTVRRWDLRDGREVSQFTGHSGKVRSVKISSDGDTLISASFDTTLNVWRASDQSLIRTLRGHAHWVHGVLLSPDAARALSWSWDHTLAEWDVKTGELMRRYYGPNCFMYAAAWSHDREMVVAGSEEGQLWIWRSSESQPVANFMAHGDSVTALATLPDPARIISAGQDRVIRVWDLDRPAKYRRYFQTIPEARERLARNANDAGALRALGEWYVFRGVFGWGTDLLENARAAGADVSSLVLARCYWQLDRGEEAVREFRRALERREAPADYLNLCIRAVLEPPRTTTQPSTRETFVR